MTFARAWIVAPALTLLLGGGAPAGDADQRSLYPSLNVITFFDFKEKKEALKVTAAQEQALKATEPKRQKLWERYVGELAKLNKSKLTQAEKNARQRALETQLAEDAFKSFGEVLRPEQVKRMRQISLQVRGMEIFDHPEVRQALKIGDKEARALQAAYDKQAGELAKQIRADLDAKKITPREAEKRAYAMTYSVPDKVRELLNKDQRKVLDDLLGEKFTYK